MTFLVADRLHQVLELILIFQIPAQLLPFLVVALHVKQPIVVFLNVFLLLFFFFLRKLDPLVGLLVLCLLECFLVPMAVEV